MFMIQTLSKHEWAKGNFNTSQSVPCGALLVCCCHSCCLGGHEGHGDPGGTRTGHPSHTSLKSISWQLAGGKLAICNHQVPDHLTHIFQNVFAICSLPLLPCSTRLGPFRVQASWSARMAPQYWEGWKSPISPAWPLPCLHGHQALCQASE